MRAKNQKKKASEIKVSGIAFVEIAAPTDEYQSYMILLLQRLGFYHVAHHKKNDIHLYQQNDIFIALNCDAKGRGASREGSFVRAHGLCASAIGLWIDDDQKAYTHAINHGAVPYKYPTPYQAPVINGVGDTLIYFCNQGIHASDFFTEHFIFNKDTIKPIFNHKLLSIDHLTFGIHSGMMNHWSTFFDTIFNCCEMNQASHEGITIKNLSNTNQTLMITLQESTLKGQNTCTCHYLQEHNGEGLFTISFSTPHLERTIDSMNEASVPFVKTNHEDYAHIADHFPESGYNLFMLAKYHMRINTDLSSKIKIYYRHVFVKPALGPVLYEIIERPQGCKKTLGNFSTLYTHFKQ